MERLFTIKYLLLILFSSFSAHILAINKPNIIILSVMDYPPYHSLSMEQFGPIPRIISAAISISGYSLELKFVPWNRAIEEAKLGEKVDGIMGVWYSEERTKYFLYSDPVMSNKWSLIKKSGAAIDITSSDYRLGTVRGYYIPESVKNKGYDIELVADDEKNLQKLFSGRIQLTLLDENYLNYLIRVKHHRYKDAFTIIKPPVAMMTQYIAISKKTVDPEQKILVINHGLKKIKSSGTFDKIIKQELINN
ncbi:substrate-binding periplasmic protein [Zooshikella ganghwensis]|uniref:substrate-binding periplasmic protein n=1 Tax=Zooshikella ganghwensis TaxID=202772 RepID=UPI00056F40C3|nr:transporter substrate-binding domain-containing protein [Zooshikella ganghwensis]